MRRPLAILLTLLLAAACLPLVVFAAPAEAEAPEVPDEVKGVHVHHLVVTMKDDPDITFPLDLTIYPEREYYLSYEEDSQNLCYWIDLEGNTWLVDLEDDSVEPQAEEDAYCYLLLDSGETVMILNDDTLDPQSLPDSAPGVHFTSEHLHKCKKASLYKTLPDSDDSGVAYDLWQYRCAVPGCDYIMEDYLATLSPMS